MKTKREILLEYAETASCGDLDCEIGAKAILRMFPEKREFDPNKVLTCVTADKAKTGMKGYFADDFACIKTCFESNFVQELLEVYEDDHAYRFNSEGIEYALFYPIEEVEG